MTIPLAVSPSVLTPGLYLTVDLLAGVASPNIGELRVALLGLKSSAGDLTLDTEVREGAGPASARTAFGPGSPGALMAEAIYTKYPQAIIDFVAVTPAAGSTTLAVTLTGVTSTAGNVIDCDIMGQTFEITWLSGETASNVVTKMIAKIASLTNVLAVTGSTGSAGVLTITSKVAGNIGEDVTVKMKLRDTQTSTETCTGATTYTALSGASADPDLTNALAAIQGTEYAFITATLSNADVATVASTNNVNRIDDHIATYNSGLSAKLQQWCIGYTGSISSAVATAADADSGNNSQVGQLVCCVNGRGLPCQLAGREIGGMLKAYSLDPAANRIGELFDGYEGSGDVNADRPTAAESESAIGGGVSLISYTPQGALIMMRPITTHSLDSTGGVDRRLLDIQNVVATYIVARDIRSALPQEFAGAKISPDLEAGDDPLPPGVTEERDIKAFCISRLRFWQRKGVVDRASLDTAVTEGTLIVQVNESDPTQVDIILPFSIVQPLAKMGVVVQRVPN